MSERPLSNFVRSLWRDFRKLKKWQQAGIGVLLIAIAAGSSGSSEIKVEESSKAQASSKVSSKPAQTNSPSPSASSEPSEASSPDSPIDFRFSALRDLSDIRKDAKEAREGITENGLGRYYWNVGEIKFNLAQLESLVPRDEYAKNWNTALKKLQKAAESLNPGDDSLTISKAKAALDEVLSKLSPLEAIARTIAN